MSTVDLSKIVVRAPADRRRAARPCLQRVAVLTVTEAPNARTPSVNPARGHLNRDELLTRLGLAPQSEGRPQEPQLLRDAVLLDQLLDSGKRFGRVDPIVHHAR